MGPSPEDMCKYLEYIGMFGNFFERGFMMSTYKAVFLRSLLDIGKHGRGNLVGAEWILVEGDRVRLELDFIAARFIKYYWDMEVAFAMRHMPENVANDRVPKQDINIVGQIHGKIIGDCGDSAWEVRKARLVPPTLAELASPGMSGFRRQVIAKSIKPEVLVHLLTDMPGLYSREPRTNHIVLDSRIIGFARAFAPALRRALNYSLALHFEKHNASARHIATKIDGELRFEERLAAVQKLEALVLPGRGAEADAGPAARS